ncbi:hypothetical protein [Bradyrhizobium sp. BR 10289]|uniref:hypothetical protein n=1 Tax=Bradyrhizobium sp. BR 10289 TaxID=2749993 RepID=UPI001C644FC8|nr:hypothetical protein [Bradyrhizobium sp. BR 10289]MBW7970099.1 hypothetical protein [Bradyrhizobium sp. BR 10289]
MTDFEKLTPLDSAVILAALVMAAGAFCPIVTLPVVGSLSYVMSGNGDGIFIVISAMGIVALILTGYRRATGVVAGAALIWMLMTLVKIAALLADTRAKLDQSMKGNPFGSIAKVLANSVGFGWGWVLLFSGAIAVIILAFANQRSSDKFAKLSEPDPTVPAFSNADNLIAELLANQQKQVGQQPTSRPASFGKRGR